MLCLIYHITSWQHVLTIFQCSSGQPLVQKCTHALKLYKTLCVSFWLESHITNYCNTYWIECILSTCLSICLSACPPIRPSIRLSVYLSVCLFLHPSIHPSIRLSIHLPTCLSIIQSTNHPTNHSVNEWMMNESINQLYLQWSIGLLIFGHHSSFFTASLDVKFLWFVTFSTVFSHFSSSCPHCCLLSGDQVISHLEMILLVW